MARKKLFPSLSLRAAALLLASLVLPVNALVSPAGASQVSLPESIRPVEDAPTSGPVNKHKAFITRRALKAEETAATMPFQIALKMRNFAELQARVAAGARISPQEMAARYEPTQADYRKVTDWLASHGFVITHRDPHHLAVFASAKVGDLEQALQVNFGRVTLEGTEYTSAVTAPNIPSTISPLVVGINGLQPHIRPHGHAVLRPADLTSTNPPYLPSQIAKAYNANTLYSSNITGAGQTIAIVIDVPPATSDLTSFWSTYGVSQSLSNITFIPVVSGTSTNSTLESTLDVEWSSSLAPGAKVRVYTTFDLNTNDVDMAYEQVYTDVITHPEYAIHQMSMSFGYGETLATGSLVATDDQYFAELAAAGVTIFASSGDGASSPSLGGHDSGGPLQVESPASDPHVTAVGGTSLYLNTDGTVSSESAWSESGGGTSIYFARPAWQTGTGVASGKYRLVPDVSLPADSATSGALYWNGAATGVYGTSWSSPSWAAFCALINQSRANAGYSSIGLLGPHIYPLLGTSNFRDITTGNNAGGSNANGNYYAGVGYDEVTGIGVPEMQNLATTLSSSLQPTVALSPASVDVTPGQNATFTATASGSPVSYQWQRLSFGATTWANLSSGGIYSGVTSVSLTINGATSAMSGDQFQCVVTYSGGGQVNSLAPSSLVVDLPLVTKAFAGQVGSPGTATGNHNVAQFNFPSGVALDSSGNLYIADFSNNQIRKVTPSGVVSVPYGSTSETAGSADGIGNAARFNQPNGVASDGSGNLYIADAGNNLIRKIVLSTGQVSTIAGFPASAGQPGAAGYTDGAGTTQALFNGPNGVALDGSGNLYVADTNNNVIRKIVLSTGQVSTLAGHPDTSNTGDAGDAAYSDGAGATQAFFSSPTGIATDSSGNVYVADLGNNVVRKITPAGVVTTLAGQAGVEGFADGPNLTAQFNAPNGVYVDGSNNVYVMDANLLLTSGSGNNLIRKISPAGVVSTLAGQAGVSGTAVGSGTAAQFYGLQAMAINSSGTFYILDTFNQVIRIAGYAPTVAVAPIAQVVTTGSPVTFSVTPSGTGPFTYQWLLNGVAISGATSSSYTISSTSSASAGNYSVTITDSYGTTTTTPVSLTVNTAIANTDSPTMPAWALLVLASLLYWGAARFLPQKEQSNFTSGSA